MKLVIIMKKIMVYNLGLFFVTVLGGSTGLAFLGNATNAFGVSLTNISMIIVVGLGTPITGFSLANASKKISSVVKEEDRPSKILTYLALGTLSVHMIAGVGMTSTSLYSVMLMIHTSFAALTGSLILGVLVLTLRNRAMQGTFSSILGRWVYSFLGLAFTAISAGAGGVALLTGSFSFTVGMAEFAILAYGFLILSAETPLQVPPSEKH